MTKIQSIWENFSDDFRSTFQKYKITVILIAIVSILYAVFFPEGQQIHSLFGEKIIPFLILFGIGTFLIETLHFKHFWQSLLGFLIAALFSFGFIYLNALPEGQSFAGIESDVIHQVLPSYVITYCIVLIALGVFVNYKKSGQPFSQYVTMGIQNLSQIAIISGALAAGIAAVIAIFIYLILDNSYSDLIVRAEILVLGCTVGIGTLHSMIHTHKETAKFFAVVVRYILLSLTMIAFAIIYLYIAKIIITQEMPSNEVFRILAALFVVGLPIWTMADSFPKDNFLVRTGIKLPYIFIPFLFLQGYSIGIRIAEFGLTPRRYLCVMLMLFEILYILFYFFKKREVGVILPILAVLAIITTAVPGINVYDLSVRSQKNNFEKYAAIGFKNLSEAEQKKMAGAYYYLKNDPFGKKYVENIDTEMMEAIQNSGFYGVNSEGQNYNYRFYSVNDLDISRYGRMTVVSANLSGDSIDLTNVPVGNDTEPHILEADVLQAVKQILTEKTSEEDLKRSEPAPVIEIGDGSILVLSDIAFTTTEEGTVGSLNLQGFWLRP